MKPTRSTHIAIAALLVAAGGASATAFAQQQGRNPPNDQQQGEQQDQDKDGDKDNKKRGQEQKGQNRQNENRQNENRQNENRQEQKGGHDRPVFPMGQGKKPDVHPGNEADKKRNEQKQQQPANIEKPQTEPQLKKTRENDDAPPWARRRDRNETRDKRDQDSNRDNRDNRDNKDQNNIRDNREQNTRDDRKPPIFIPPGQKPPQNADKARDNVPPPRIRVTPAGIPDRLEDLKRKRVQKVEDGGKRVVIEEPDKRVIVKQDNRMVIQRDETSRIKLVAPNARFERRGDKTISVVDRPGGVKVISETDANGQLLRRYRRGNDGREYTIVDNRYSDKRRRKDKFGRNIAIGAGVGLGIVAGAAILDSIVNVPPPRVRIPRDKYIVDYERASDEDVYEALSAPPVDTYSDRYTLNEIRATQRLRERMRRIDLDDITFEFGSWEVDPSQYRKLERIARGMLRVIDRDPNEVFLIEGYTDAVGTREDNLTLSDRRAESVAVILTEQFQVPFENLTTQGYGEDYLKIPTLAPERINRRVAVRRITPLLARDDRRADDRDRGDDGRYDDRGDGRRDDRDRGYDDSDDRRYDDRDDRRYDDGRR